MSLPYFIEAALIGCLNITPLPFTSSSPKSRMRLTTDGDSSELEMALFNRLTIASGVPAGAMMPIQRRIS